MISELDKDKKPEFYPKTAIEYVENNEFLPDIKVTILGESYLMTYEYYHDYRGNRPANINTYVSEQIKEAVRIYCNNHKVTDKKKKEILQLFYNLLVKINTSGRVMNFQDLIIE